MARGEHYDAVADRHDFLKLGGDKQNGESAVRKHTKFVEDFLFGADIDAARWFIREQDMGRTMTPTR